MHGDATAREVLPFGCRMVLQMLWHVVEIAEVLSNFTM
jgi:hypothetical protein